MQLWKDYFQNLDNEVKIFGIDINPNCKVLEEENIKIFIGSLLPLKNFLIWQIKMVSIFVKIRVHLIWKPFGGRYKGDTFIEYSKNLIDFLHAQYSETDELVRNKYTEKIKTITYYDSMVFINKKKRTTKSIDVQIEKK